MYKLLINNNEIEIDNVYTTIETLVCEITKTENTSIDEIKAKLGNVTSANIADETGFVFGIYDTIFGFQITENDTTITISFDLTETAKEENITVEETATNTETEETTTETNEV